MNLTAFAPLDPKELFIIILEIQQEVAQLSPQANISHLPKTS